MMRLMTVLSCDTLSRPFDCYPAAWWSCQTWYDCVLGSCRIVYSRVHAYLYALLGVDGRGDAQRDRGFVICPERFRAPSEEAAGTEASVTPRKTVSLSVSIGVAERAGRKADPQQLLTVAESPVSCQEPQPKPGGIRL
jgi:hypothetical protein